MENEWDVVRNDRLAVGSPGMGILRITLLFGSAAVALALIIAPIAESQTRSIWRRRQTGRPRRHGTGSVGAAATRCYTIRKSVLQSSPDAVCVIRDNGQRIGDCQ